MRKVGIMGGTFNPIHNVHLIMAEEARRQYELDVVFFMPSKNPPHKEKKDIASDEHRKRMIQHAIADNPYFEFSDLELRRQGTTYTKDTLKDWKSMYPEDEIYFILGGDSLASLEQWCEPAKVFAGCHILAANRDHTNHEQIVTWISYYQKQYHASIYEVEMPMLSISSEQIRSYVQAGKSIAHYCPACIEAYIRNNSLYGYRGVVCHGENEFGMLQELLRACLKPKRYEHTMGVAMTAANMALIHGVDVKKATLAGWLHDCAKYFSGQEQIELCNEYGIPLSDVERENTALIHGKLGAYIAKTKYQITDEDILNAVCYHTTGRTDMSDLEKIIYIADYIEPQRDMDCKPYSLQKIRECSMKNLDKTLRMVLKNTVNYLEKSKVPVDEMAQITYEYYKKE